MPKPPCMGDCAYRCKCWPDDECDYGPKHSWVAGMMYVADEDLDTIAAMRDVECEQCEKKYTIN